MINADQSGSMAPLTVKKSLQQFRLFLQKLNLRLEELMKKKDSLQLVLTSQSLSVTSDTDTASAKHENDRLTAAATDILIEILELKVDYLVDCIEKLEERARVDARSLAPMELRVARFEDWVETNQRLYQLNSKLYEIEKVKVNIERKTNKSRRAQSPEQTVQTDSASITTTASELAATSLVRVLSRYTSTNVDRNLSLYMSNRLEPRGNRETLESKKIAEYIEECEKFPGTMAEPPLDANGEIRGAHPTSYHSFVQVLCNYITERHQETQGEDLPFSTVYTAIEHHLVPRMMAYILPYIRDQERDKKIRQQCDQFANITLEQLGVARPLWTTDLVPFADAIAHMRATYFSQSPTDKMYSVVSSARALYDSIGDSSQRIDGDTFMDLWVYVAIKANVKDMATNMTFMVEYGNPQLSMDEAGYYLTTLSGAMSFIENMTPQQLVAQRSNNNLFVVCEPNRAMELAAMSGSPFEVVQQREELTGYQAAVVREWVLDTTQLFHSVLVPSTDPEAKLPVAVIRISTDASTPQHVQYFFDKLSESGVEGITSHDLSLGTALVCAQPCTDKLVMIQSGTVEEHLPTITHSLQLIRLGSEVVEPFEDLNLHRQLPFNASTSFSPSLSPTESITTDTKPLMRPRDRFTMPARDRFTLPASSNLKKPQKVHLKRVTRFGSSNDDIEPVDSLSPSAIVIQAEVHHNSLSPQPAAVSPTLAQEEINTSPEPADAIENHKNDCVPRGLLDEHSIEVLESNFATNHLNGNKPESVGEAMKRVIQNAQLLLQRLNFLSSMHKLDGFYDDITMKAVSNFQIYSNDEDLFSTAALPEDGILNVATHQLLRQQLLSTFSNLLRLGREFGLVVEGNFNPLSFDSEESRRFKEVVGEFQTIMKMNHCRQGVLCSRTASLIQRMLRLRSNSAINNPYTFERGMTL